MHRMRQLVTGIAALAVMLAVLVGVPAALVRFVGWPLPTVWPSLEEIGRALQLGIPDTTVIKTLAVVVWIAWVQLAAGLLAEMGAVLRRRPARAWFVLPGVRVVAARLVTAVLLLTATAGAAGRGAGSLEAVLATAPLVEEVEPWEDGAPPREAASRGAVSGVAVTTVTTTARDSWWKLAERHLGDGMRWREIRDLNVGRAVADGQIIRTETEQLDEGWHVLVPAEGMVVGGDGAVPAEGGAVVGGGGAGERGAAEDAVWLVEAGDHFWGIAEQTLTESWGRSPSDAEIAPYWQQVVDANHDRLAPPHDPDVIFPGQEFVVPPTPVDPTEDATAEVGEAPSSEASSSEVAPSSPEPAVSSPRPGDGWVGALTPREPAVPKGGAAGESSGSASAAALAFEDGEVEERTAWGTPVGLTEGVAVTALLAAGVGAVLRRRRRMAVQQRVAGMKLPTPAPEAVAAEARLAAATPDGAALDSLAALLASIPPEVRPVLVTTTDDGLVTLLFDDDAELPAPPEPWELAEDGVDGPVGWSARIGAHGPERSIGLPLLVTLGRIGDMNVLANLGGMRTLAVAGDTSLVRRTLRTFAMEVATSPVAGPVEVAVAGDDRLATLEQVRLVDDLEVELVAATAERDQGIVIADRTVRLLVDHTGADLRWAPDELDGLVGLVTAGAAGRWTLTVTTKGTGRLRLPDGAEAELVLPDVDPDLLDDELDQLTEPLPVEADPPAINGHAVPVVATEAAPSRRVDDAVCEVRLLGPFEAIRDGEPLTGLTRQMREVLAYLATHPDGVTGERLEDAVWTGRARLGTQRVRSVLTKLRTALGEDADGNPLLPRRAAAEDRIRVHHVTTDIARAFAYLDRAKSLAPDAALNELRAALELVRGEPFEDLPVSWSIDVAQEAIVHLQDAALVLAAAGRRRGDYDAAEWAIQRGLKLCDPSKALYEEWAKLEAASGRDEAAVDRIWRRFQTKCDDALGDAYPPPATVTSSAPGADRDTGNGWEMASGRASAPRQHWGS